MADVFGQMEENDGIRLSWNVWPNSRIEATKAVIPFGALYTPLKALPNMVVVPYKPVQCKSCTAALNPYCQTDFSAAMLWICPFCHTRNHFPQHYAGISESNMPAELFPDYSTIEYTLEQHAPASPPAYVFVIDTALSEEELQGLRTTISQALQLIPDYAQVGLITYGTHVQVHELGFTECSKSYVFRGSKEYTAAQVAQQLGLAGPARGGPPPGHQGPGGPAAAAAAAAASQRRFVLPYSDCEFSFNGILEELQRDAFQVPVDQRPSRCTGTALQTQFSEVKTLRRNPLGVRLKPHVAQVAAGLTDAVLPGGGRGAGMGAVRIMLFVGGPTTEGGGQVVAKELMEPIRSHKDLVKETATHYKKARKFYDALAAQLVRQGHSLDIFACSLDQVGLAEMKMATEATGGMSVQTDTFHNPVFGDSLQRVFAKPGDAGHLGMASNAICEIITSRDVKVQGLLAPAAPVLEKHQRNINVAETSVGMGGTTAWRLASLDSRTTLAAFFEIVAGGRGGPETAAPQFFLQFVTRYLHECGELRCRVTTVTRQWTDGQNLQELIAAFDQEAAAVLVARLATFKMETEEDFDATRWLDRVLIRLAARFGDYRKDDPSSFQLAPQMSFFPGFLFNLRRSQFVQVFGNSPDETAYCRLYLNRETTADALTMIQPQLITYGMDAPPQPALLDVTSIVPQNILLLDSFFYVVVFHGSVIAQWRKAEYHKQEEYAGLASLLEAPKADAQEIVSRRFPVPRLVECDQNGSQARFLLAKLNPSSTYNSANDISSEVIMTDDVSLQVFMEHLKKLAVQP